MAHDHHTHGATADVVLSGELTLHEAQARGDRLEHELAEGFGIEHATLELECHACEDDDHDAGTPRRSATL